jgi:DNA invertase Pin-like site-specific DNA recombinase
MKCAIYIRVSTDDQDYNNQLPSIRALVESKGWDIFKVYAENASAWKNGHQKEFKKLTQDAQNGEFQKLVIWSIDRLTREGPLRLLQIFETLSSYGVMILSVQEPWTDIPSEFQDVMISFYGFMARFESQRRSARTKEGMLKAKGLGKRVGRPPGSKDTKKRNTEGYKLRHARERIKRHEGNDIPG